MDITRRTFIAGVGATALAPSAHAAPRVRLPRALKPGDRVAIVAPAGLAENQEHIDKSMAKVRSLGYEPVAYPNVLKNYGYLAGTDEERAADLNAALRDPAIRGIFYLRGGYGAMRILPLLDYRAMKHDPKVTIGFSDVTALHLAFLAKSDVITFHGPCAESSWSDFSRATLGVMTSPAPFGVCKQAPDVPRTTLMPGVAEGRLVAGNLSLISSLIGTDFCPSLRGAILALEDIGEDPYRVDRMLTEILLAPKSHGLKGLVFGDFRERLRPGEVPEQIDPSRTFTLMQVLQDRSRAFGVPSWSGLCFGHTRQNHILPLGVRARLDADQQTLTILEKSVR